LIRPELLHLFPLFAMLTWASFTDLRERKIRNWLTLTVMLTGLAQSFTPFHTVTPGQAALGLLVGFGIPFILFAIGALGGGDVKLLAGVGAWLGPFGALGVFMAAAIIGMVIVLIQALWQRRLLQLIYNSALVAINVAHVQEVGIEHVKATGASARSVDRPLPYAIPIFLAVLVLKTGMLHL
jgi:prepilin peptidase CpaA